MSLVGRKASCINLDQDVKSILIHEYGISNLSEFINSLLWSYVEANEPELPIEVKRAVRAREVAKKIREEHQAQQKLIEEERNYEKEVLEMIEREEAILRDASKEIFSGNLDQYVLYIHGGCEGRYSEYWERKAKVVSQICGFPVSSERIISFMKKEAGVVC